MTFVTTADLLPPAAAYHAPSKPPADYPALHCVTPLIYSESLSSRSRHHIWLKLETSQLTGSFKPRGIGRSAYAAVQKYGKDVHLVVASGGKAGLGLALSARTLGVKCSVFVHASTDRLIINKLQSYGAMVNQAEGGWSYVDAGARKLVGEDAKAVYVHAFEGDDLVKGHVSVIDEVYEQLPELSVKRGMDKVTRPDMVVSAVGGGGMIRGIMLGLSEHAAFDNSEPAHCVGVCTLGADAWSLSLEQEDGYTPIKDAHSKARSLVSNGCSPLSVRDARVYGKTGSLSLDPDPVAMSSADTPYLSQIRIDDAYAGAAAWHATRELNHLVELSCGAAVAVAEQHEIINHLVKTKGLPEKSNVVIICCGGTRVSLEDVVGFEKEYGEGYGKILVNGQEIKDVPAPVTA